jgi:beta-lactamase superfamily II metal-dependent hydrolase
VSKKFAAVAGLVLLLLGQRPHAQGSLARIYFVDIGTGAGTLIVSPTGRTLLVDGGPPGAGTTKIIPTLDALGIATIDDTVLTHYHIDHDAGLTEVIAAGRVGGIAYDNGDAAGVIPPSLTGSTGRAYTAYKNAIAAAGIARATIAPGQVIDLGGGMRATCLVVGGRLLGGGSVPITNEDLNSEAISLLVEYNNFDFIISGDLTGGGSTSTEKSPDVETWVGQLAGDVDVAQLNHHGSTSASNQRFLTALKAEVAVAETGSTNTFGHPNRETVNKFLNTPATAGNSFAGTTQPPPGIGPVFYQIEQSSPSDDRESQQGYYAATIATAGSGTILLTTDGTTTYSMQSFDDSGVRIDPLLHSYPIDGASNGPTIDFPPTVIPTMSPVAPLAADPVVVSAQVNDDHSPVSAVTLSYSLDGALQPPLTMTPGGGLYVATIAAQPDATRVDYTVTGTAGGLTTSYSSGYFSGVTPIGTLRVLNSKGEPLYAGYPARVRGLVTAGSGLFGAASNDDYVDDGTGAINLYRSTNGISAFTPTTTGQTVEAVGHIESVGGRFRLDLTDSVEKIGSPWHTTILPDPIGTPTPLVVTFADLNAAPELYEGRLVSVTGVSIISGAIPSSSAPFDAFVVVGDGTGSFVMKIDHDTDVEGFTPPSVFTLTGILQQDDFLRPFDANYDVAPRSRVDLGAAAPAPPPLLAIGDARADLVNNADLNPTPDFIPDLIGKVVKVRGTVTSINFRPAGTEYYIQDATGGIDIFAGATSFGSFGIGTTVEAAGSITQFNGLTELQVTTVTPTGSATAPTPQLITLSQLGDGGAGEAVEGRLIRVDAVTITNGSFPASGATANVTITDATGSALMRIDSDTNIDGTPTTAGTFSVVALASQFVAAPPFDSGYQILPRSLSDIVVTGTPALAASPTALDFGSVAVAGSAIRSVTITNVGLSAIDLNPPFAINGTASSQYSAAAPAVTTLAPGAATTVAVTFAPTTSGTKNASLSITGTGGDTAVVGLTGLATAPGGGGGAPGVLISEFRTRGPSGGNDEFVEIYNNSDAPIDISGWKMKGSNSSATTGTRATVPLGTILPARRHYLFTNSGASGYSGSVPGNTTYGTGITDDGGVAITTSADVIMDQVGLSTGSAFKEGTVLAPMAGANQQAYERLAGGANGSTQDTGNNAADFVLHTSSIDPQNLASLPTGAIKALPTALDFGAVAAGGTASATVTITNSSATALPLTTPFLIAGMNPEDFVIDTPGVSLLAGGASTTVSISFHPSAAGGKSATATIASPGGAPTVALTGVATPGISVTPSSLDFGSLDIGASATSSVTISNDDPTSPVTLSPPFQLTGANPGEFSVGIPGATTLAGGESTSLVVGFVPTAAGGKSATLAITSTAGSVRTVSLSGSSACPAIAIGGSLPAGILLTPYSRSLIAGGGEPPYTFSVAAGTIPAGLTFSGSGVLSGTPTLASTFDFTVQVADGVGCLGTASYSVPILAASIAIAPTPLDFSTVFLGSLASAPVTITNSSGFPVVLNAPFSITGTDATQFTVSAPVTTTLASGASTTAQVTFTPVAVGAKSATLNVTSSAGGAASVALIAAGHFGPSVGSTVLISELRFRGAGGAGGVGAASDEFVEIYNNSGSAIDISGYRLLASNNAGVNSTRATVPALTNVPPHGHYLFVNTAAQPGLVALANQTYGTGITDDGGVAIALPDGTTLLDQVGLSAGSAFKEGASLTPLTASMNQSYERKAGGAAGSSVDTNDNAVDFQLISPSDPQNLTSAPAPAVCPAIDVFGPLTGGTFGVPYAGAVMASGGASPYTFTASGTLPFGLTLTSGGAIGGTPTLAGLYPFTVQATDANGCGGVADFSIAIGRAAVALSWATPAPIVYGTALGVSQLNATADVAGTFVYTPVAGTVLDAGPGQPLHVAFTPADGANYQSSGGDVTLDVTKRALTATADSTAREFGAANPPFTGSVTGVVNGDAITGVFTATATAASPEGSYPILASLLDPAGRLPNYVVALVNGTLTVVDTHPPVLTLPSNVFATATTPAGAAVTYSASAADPVDGSRPITCAPASGATFPIGSTVVHCSATDSNGHSTNGTFVVTVATGNVPGRMVGDAEIEAGATRHQVEFVVQERATGADAGAFVYRLRTRTDGPDRTDTFFALTVSNVSFYNVPGVSPGPIPPSGIDTVTFEGVGHWNGRSGYRFTASAADAGEPGPNRDSFAITISDATGHVVASANGVITGGSIQSLRLAR